MVDVEELTPTEALNYVDSLCRYYLQIDVEEFRRKYGLGALPRHAMNTHIALLLGLA